MSTKNPKATPKRPKAGHVAGKSARLMTLTAQQLVFCQKVASGLNDTDSYAAAYPRSKNPGAEAGHFRALKYCKRALIEREIARLRKRIEDKFVLSKDEWLMEFRGIARDAREDRDHSGATGALRQIGLAMPKWYAPEGIDVRVDSLAELMTKIVSDRGKRTP